MSSRANKKRIRRLREMCRGCAFRAGTDAFEARMGRPRHPLDVGFKAEVDKCLASGGAISFYCHSNGIEDQDGALILPEKEEHKRLCGGWLKWLTAEARRERRARP